METKRRGLKKNVGGEPINRGQYGDCGGGRTEAHGGGEAWAKEFRRRHHFSQHRGFLIVGLVRQMDGYRVGYE